MAEASPRLRPLPEVLIVRAFLAVSFSLAGCADPSSTRLALERGAAGGRDAFVASRLDRAYLASPAAASADWSGIFQVFVEDPARSGVGPGALPPIAGSTRAEGEALRFEPRFPLEPGLSYRARLRSGPWIGRGEGDGPPLEAVFAIPAKALRPEAIVERIYPSADVLPENLLKFYLYFSRPMRRAQAYSRIHLVETASGRVVDAPFLELGEELWDPSATRFTLFFDPGRVKRGVRPNEEIGAPLVSGMRYALVIDAGWLDAAGAPLREGRRKEFTVRGADREPPDPRAWKISPPAAGSSDPLSIESPEPLDHALFVRLLRVSGPEGRTVEGEAAVGDGERAWSFRPVEPWRAGRHEIIVESALEDLAGNGVGRPFEVDEAIGIAERLGPESVAVPFEVAAPSSQR